MSHRSPLSDSPASRVPAAPPPPVRAGSTQRTSSAIGTPGNRAASTLRRQGSDSHRSRCRNPARWRPWSSPPMPENSETQVASRRFSSMSRSLERRPAGHMRARMDARARVEVDPAGVHGDPQRLAADAAHTGVTGAPGRLRAGGVAFPGAAANGAHASNESCCRRRAAIWAYSGFSSMPMVRRPCLRATRPVVPEPKNGSKTVPGR